MKLLITALLLATATAFTVQPRPRTHTSLKAALTTAPASVENLAKVAERINEEQGVFVYDAQAQSDLKAAVKELEAVNAPPTQAMFDEHFCGDWVLMCTTTASGIDTTKLPFLNQGSLLGNVRKSLNSRVKVVQRIKSSASSQVDRVDHVIEYQPPKSVADVLGQVPDVVKGLNLNPLELTKSKITLVHKAQVESVLPKLETKLSLQSIVLNVAGKSQYLEPAGADVLGINVPLGEFLNAGAFETTYMDENIRISRSKVGPVDQLRVFVKATDDDVVVDAFEQVDDDDDDFSNVEWVEDDMNAALEEDERWDDDAPSDVESS